MELTVEGKTDLIVPLVRHVVSTRYEDLPSDVVEITKQHVLDQLATTVGGSGAPGCVELLELLREWGGREESTIPVHGFKVPAPSAARAIATMGHALDYDDCDDRNGMHGGVAPISAGLAIAERKGGVRGKEFLAAVAVGIDVSLRLALSQTPVRPIDINDGWFNTQLYGYIGAPVTAGRILGLGEEEMIHAIGIAYQEATGTNQTVWDGALTKRMGPGFAARAGVEAPLLAQRGVTGTRHTLEGTAGLFHMFGEYDPAVLMADLGTRFLGSEVSFKPWPSCRQNHPFDEAALALTRENGFKAEDIAEVIAYHGEAACANARPIELRRRPPNIVFAQFSIPWNIAVALVYGELRIQNFSPEGIKDPAVLEITERISCQLDDSLTRRTPIQPAVVEVLTKDGRRLSKRVEHAYGHPEKRMGWEAFGDKFRDCAAWAARPLSSDKVETVIETVKGLEQLDDVAGLLRLLS